MNSLKNILAKSNPKETLEEHTTSVLEIWSQLRDRYKEIIIDENFWFDSFYAVAFHDLGKICNNFQEVISGKRPFYDDERIRHEFLSGMFLLLHNHSHYDNNPESLVAVFSHHKPFNDDGFNKHVIRNPVTRYSIEKEIINEFIEFTRHKAAFYKIPPFKLNEKLKYSIINEYAQLLKWYQKKVYGPISAFDRLKDQNRTRYIYHKAILNISDWTASGHLKLEDGLCYDMSYLREKIITKLIDHGKTEIARDFNFKKFQTAGIGKRNVIAIAPTGSGKTEAALLWASTKDGWERIIYLLPTRVTSNSLFQRLKTYFGADKVQLIHSSARLYLKEQLDGDYDQKNYFRDKSFFRNINVCTVDQILTQGFNLGFWEVKTFHMQNAWVIIDEIHLYSPYTLGLIVSTIKYLKYHFNTRFFIMTATMPQKLFDLLKEALGDVFIVNDTELLDSARNRFEVRESVICELTEEITDQIEQNKKVLVVANTVDKAVELYSQLKTSAQKAGVNIVCYHSRFVNKHRARKESEIFDMDKENAGGVLIATQVVEVSLDIDFDILFTENAPIDAIIQRAGRVNRRRGKKYGKVIIAQHSDISKKVYDAGAVLEDTYAAFAKNNGRKLTEHELSQMVDIVYENWNIKENPHYHEGINKHREIQHKFNYIKDLTSDDKVFTREDLNTISVIPVCYYEKLSKSQDKDDFPRHELSVNKHWKSKASTKELKGYCFLAGEYTYETGFKLSTKQSIEFY